MSLQIAKKSLQIVLSSQGSRRVDANLGDATGLLRICRSEEQSSLRDLDSASYDAKNLISTLRGRNCDRQGNEELRASSSHVGRRGVFLAP